MLKALFFLDIDQGRISLMLLQNAIFHKSLNWLGGLNKKHIYI